MINNNNNKCVYTSTLFINIVDRLDESNHMTRIQVSSLIVTCTIRSQWYNIIDKESG